MDDFVMYYSVEEYYDDEIAEYLYNRARNNEPSRMRTRYESSYDYDYDNVDSNRDYYRNGYED